MTEADASAVVRFWREAGPQRWFASDAAFDRAFDTRFGELHFSAARRELDAWMDNAEGGLALLLLLDQFPRNVFRGSGHAYATDPLAHHFATRMLQAGFDQQVEAALRMFCYLPFQHSERIEDQERAVSLLQALGEPKWALHHRDIIRRFGRFPHRNAALGRENTPEERTYLEAGGFGDAPPATAQ